MKSRLLDNLVANVSKPAEYFKESVIRPEGPINGPIEGVFSEYPFGTETMEKPLTEANEDILKDTEYGVFLCIFKKGVISIFMALFISFVVQIFTSTHTAYILFSAMIIGFLCNQIYWLIFIRPNLHPLYNLACPRCLKIVCQIRVPKMYEKIVEPYLCRRCNGEIKAIEEQGIIEDDTVESAIGRFWVNLNNRRIGKCICDVGRGIKWLFNYNNLITALQFLSLCLAFLAMLSILLVGTFENIFLAIFLLWWAFRVVPKIP